METTTEWENTYLVLTKPWTLSPRFYTIKANKNCPLMSIAQWYACCVSMSLFLSKIGSLCPWTHQVDQTGFKLPEICLPLPPECWKAHATMPSDLRHSLMSHGPVIATHVKVLFPRWSLMSISGMSWVFILKAAKPTEESPLCSNCPSHQLPPHFSPRSCPSLSETQQYWNYVS